MAVSRSGQAQYAQRVNAAADLIAGGASAVDAAARLADRFGVSPRQARRYVDQASSTGRRVVPETSVVFTVKLPASLAARVRRTAARSGTTMSALVAEALSEFLSRRRGRGSRG
jgi:predicted DNA-binding transcriptional regulator YafY